MDTDMKKTNPTKTKPTKTKAAPKLRDLTAKHNPKGGRPIDPGVGVTNLGNDINHNETLVCDRNR
jgi:hypothetical protein